MKKYIAIAVVVLLFTILFVYYRYPVPVKPAGQPSQALQSNPASDDYVRNTKDSPDLTSTEWLHYSPKDTVDGSILTEAYINTKLGIVAYLSILNRNGSRQEIFIEFGTRNVGRAVLNVDGKWYIGKAPFFDSQITSKENELNFSVVLDPQSNTTAMKISLDTLEGIKSITVTK